MQALCIAIIVGIAIYHLWRDRLEQNDPQLLKQETAENDLP